MLHPFSDGGGATDGERIRLGFALCGSFCTIKRVIAQMKILIDMGFDIYPIMSEKTYFTDTRFGTAENFRNEIEELCGKKIWHLITEVEPIGPKSLLDILLIAPCTGNSLAKLAMGISDTAVTLAAKTHLRNAKPLVIAVSTNDALGANAKNLGQLLNIKNIYFVPFEQDDPIHKPASLVAVMEKIPETIMIALKGQQIQPVII